MTKRKSIYNLKFLQLCFSSVKILGTGCVIVWKSEKRGTVYNILKRQHIPLSLFYNSYVAFTAPKSLKALFRSTLSSISYLTFLPLFYDFIWFSTMRVNSEWGVNVENYINSFKVSRGISDGQTNIYWQYIEN